MRKTLQIFFFVFLANVVVAQPYANDWINYSQKYFKFKVFRDGVYRIDYKTLQAAGIPITSINPKNFQLFGRGNELPLYIEGEADDSFDATDFIEFYAERNDAWLDSNLYTSATLHPNPYYSLFNDTAVYFLTWNTSTNNKRFTEINNNNYQAYTPDKYFINEVIDYYNAEYYAGETNAIKTTEPGYTENEGFFSNVIEKGKSLTTNLSTPNVYSSGPAAVFKTVAIGASKASEVYDHHLIISQGKNNVNYIPMIDTLFRGYKAFEFNFSTALSNIGTTTQVKFESSNIGINNPSNRTAVSYVNLRYPQSFDLNNNSSYKMHLPYFSPNLQHLVEMTNIDPKGTPVHLYELTTGKRVLVTPSGLKYKALIPHDSPSIKELTCFVFSESEIINVDVLLPVGVSGQFTDYTALQLDDAYIIVTHPKLLSAVTEYANYRASPAGGNHSVALCDINELYDQYAYGVVKHPLAIRNLADQALGEWNSPPQNLFLIGKSINPICTRHPSSSGCIPVDANNFDNCFVPTYGNPSSDNLLTAGLQGTNLQTAIPTGRLAARSDAEVTLYLNKVKEYESNPAEEWMKNVLHFGGGGNSLEQLTFKKYLNNYEKIIEDTSFGGKVETFLKTSSAPIQINQSEYLRNKINNGVSLMTFFGHASGSGFDVSIDNPSSYDNQGKYPFLLANSCLAGDLHTISGNSSSEQFVIIKDRGVIGYLASVSLGTPYELNLFSDRFYKNLGINLYGESVGKQIQKTVEEVQGIAPNNSYLKATCLEMTLHGDPAVVLNAHAKPDYKISPEDVYFELDQDSLSIFAIITNLGKSIHDTIIVELQRTFPGGDNKNLVQRIKTPSFKDTLLFRMDIDLINGIGLNKFVVKVDLFDEVEELSEANNTTFPAVDYLIRGGGISPVYPYEYAIIPNNKISLKASTNDLFAPAKDYIFQLDTNNSFINPLEQKVINSKGGLVEWMPNTVFKDSIAYYWRVSPDSVDAFGYSWQQSSFQYIGGKTGWGQSHYFQFEKDAYQYVNYSATQRKFIFANNVNTVNVSTGYVDWADHKYRINNSVKYLWACYGWGGGMLFVLIDPVTGEVVQNKPVDGKGQFGSLHCGDDDAFEYHLKSADSRTGLATFLDSIPDGYYFLGYSGTHTNNLPGDTTLYAPFEKLGSTKIRNLKSSNPYVIWGKKEPGYPLDEVIDTTTFLINFTDTFSSNWQEGIISTPIIGPAASWDSLYWEQFTLDDPLSDSIRLRLIGIKKDGSETVLVDGFSRDSAAVNLAVYADATIYPYIKLAAHIRDEVFRTPAQLKSWRVLYEPVPEAMINPLGYYTFYKDTVQEGDNIIMQTGIENISDQNFNDSLLITYWLEDQFRLIHKLPDHLRKAPFIAGDTLIDKVILKTNGFPGKNALWMEVNPINHPKSQKEQYHFNNILRKEFYVTTDNTNPILDVTFDGIHILNGDIVSSEPFIEIQLLDENVFIALDDTSYFKVWLLKESEGDLTNQNRVFFNSGDLNFIPAELPVNRAKLEYTPKIDKDGVYVLQVEAVDASANESGSANYSISFEVITKSSITEVMNYPNPFSTATRFVFTLTGAKVPTYFKIQIITITGKVVREIQLDELGPIHIGRNITEYAWDGKDGFGDQLANGIYLYRVITQIDGESIEKKSSGADQYMHKGFGKMYLMR